MTQKTNIKEVEIPTIGKLAEKLLRVGRGVEGTLEAIKKVFPEAKTTKKCIYYYANHAEPKIVLARRSTADPKALKALLKSLGKAA